MTIRKNIAIWYYALRNLAIGILLAILIYVGIRMAISTVASDEAKYKVIEKESIEKESFDNIIDETKKVLTDKSNEYNGLKKELESAKVEIERLREKLNGIENNFKNLS